MKSGSPTRADDEADAAYDSAGDAGDSGGLVGADAVSAAIAADESETKIKNLCGNIPAGKKYFLVPALYILEAYRIKEVSQLQRTFFLFPRRAGRAYSGPPPPPWNLSGSFQGTDGDVSGRGTGSEDADGKFRGGLQRQEQTF